MNALFYNQLAAESPVVRDHVRLGAEDRQVTQHKAVAPGIATSFAVLDAFLPWHGWPVGAMTEIMTDTVGCGELSLLLPAMARLTQEKRPVLCIGAPHANKPSLRRKISKGKLMVSRTSTQNRPSGHGRVVDSIQYELRARNPAPPAFIHTRPRDDADPLSRQILYVAALTGLVALWLCGG